jgi:hypothetical protein
VLVGDCTVRGRSCGAQPGRLAARGHPPLGSRSGHPPCAAVWYPAHTERDVTSKAKAIMHEESGRSVNAFV